MRKKAYLKQVSSSNPIQTCCPSLLPYQAVGVKWLIQAWLQDRSVILADEMGLGKTIQAIAFIAELLFVYKISRPFLITVPLSTINNWKREFELWLPEVSVLMY